jgi:hypothetical protein
VSGSIPTLAARAWQAYNAMEATKQRHFTYMSGLEKLYSKYGVPSEEQKQMLERLLKEHDVQVNAFKTAMQELRELDAKAHNDLLDYIAQLHAVMAPFLRDA